MIYRVQRLKRLRHGGEMVVRTIEVEACNEERACAALPPFGPSQYTAARVLWWKSINRWFASMTGRNAK
jgi:hypothetical protein